MHRMKPGIAACLLLLLMVQAAGCRSWKAVTEPVPMAVAQQPNRKVRVVLQDRRTVEPDSVKVRADALVTYLRAAVDTIPVAEIEVIQFRQFSVLKTVGLVVGIGGGALVAFVLAWLAFCGPYECGQS